MDFPQSESAFSLWETLSLRAQFEEGVPGGLKNKKFFKCDFYYFPGEEH
jgi:hypothetical protein